MSKRKETPDILADILQASTVMAQPVEAERQVPAARPPLSPPPQMAPRRSGAKAPRVSTQWEYQVVSFQDYHGWRPRFCNGLELSNWMDGPLLHEYLEQLGQEGWELAAAASGEQLYATGDRHQLYFKRVK